MHKKLVTLIQFIVLFAAVKIAFAQELDEAAIFLNSQSLVRVGVETISLPGNEPMGMLGTSFLLPVKPNVFFGLAAYSAVTGQRGGFYTAGGELAYEYQPVDNIVLNAGIYAGGGGGGPYMVGGGLMLRPHADLMWNFTGVRAGISVSRVAFPNGNIGSNQLGLIADFDSNFRHTSFEHAGQKVALTKRSGVGFDRALIVAGAYFPSRESTDWGGVPLQSPIQFVGSRMEQLITPNVFWGLEAAGAVSGGVPGYAEFLGTAGAEMPIWNNHITLGARMALGTGGGGYVTNVGGGVLLKAGYYATANFSRSAHLSFEGGEASAPTGNFRATYKMIALHWDLDHPYSAAEKSEIIGNEWIAGTQHYFGAARLDGSRQDMDCLTMKMNRFVSESVYLTGQAHSAYGGYAGGYAVGLVGGGYRTTKNTFGISAGAELLAGAGAGGWVASGGGSIIQSMAYLSYDLSKSISGRLGVGRVKSAQGELDSELLDVGMTFAFGTGRRG